VFLCSFTTWNCEISKFFLVNFWLWSTSQGGFNLLHLPGFKWGWTTFNMLYGNFGFFFYKRLHYVLDSFFFSVGFFVFSLMCSSPFPSLYIFRIWIFLQVRIWISIFSRWHLFKSCSFCL
jgi:hypothetical protein